MNVSFVVNKHMRTKEELADQNGRNQFGVCNKTYFKEDNRSLIV